jgi:hypothetical protein
VRNLRALSILCSLLWPSQWERAERWARSVRWSPKLNEKERLALFARVRDALFAPDASEIRKLQLPKRDTRVLLDIHKKLKRDGQGPILRPGLSERDPIPKLPASLAKELARSARVEPAVIAVAMSELRKARRGNYNLPGWNYGRPAKYA